MERKQIHIHILNPVIFTCGQVDRKGTLLLYMKCSFSINQWLLQSMQRYIISLKMELMELLFRLIMKNVEGIMKLIVNRDLREQLCYNSKIRKYSKSDEVAKIYQIVN